MSQTPPGAPGLQPRWTSSAKSGVGTAVSSASRLWFTISHGILNEVYYPRIDRACTRDLRLARHRRRRLFLGGKARRHAHASASFEDGVPAFGLVNTASDGRYRIDKTILADPFRATSAAGHPLRRRSKATPPTTACMSLLAPHLVNARVRTTPPGSATTRAIAMLFASGSDGVSLALAASRALAGPLRRLVGFSDGWQQAAPRRAPRSSLPASRGRQCRADRRARIFRRRERQRVAGARLRSQA